MNKNDMRNFMDLLGKDKDTSLLKEEKTKSSNNTKGKQKDWIIYDKDHKKMFCIAIAQESDEKPWKLIEWVNFFDLDHAKFNKILSKGYHTMFMASTKRDEYTWVIAEHKHSKEDISNDDFFVNLIPKNKLFKGPHELDIEIDKEEFDKNMKKYTKNIMFSSSK
mgnify:CR=1 FL=1